MFKERLTHKLKNGIFCPFFACLYMYIFVHVQIAKQKQGA